MMRSWAPMRVNMRSTGASRAEAAGTLQPSCAACALFRMHSFSIGAQSVMAGA